MSQEIFCGFEAVEAGICEISKGSKLSRHGLAEIMLEHYCEGERELWEGITLTEQGLRQIECALDDTREGTARVREGLCKLREAAEDIKCGAYRQALDHAYAGIDCVEDGLTEIEKCLEEKSEHGLRLIREGLDDIREGERNVVKGIEEALNGRTERGIKHSRQGLCGMEEGVGDIEAGLRGVCFQGRHEAMRRIQLSLHDVREGLRQVERGITEILEDQVCEGARSQRQGLRHIRESVDEIEDGLCELFQRDLYFC